LDTFSNFEQWQIINAVTWQASDTSTVKNILSYGEFLGTTNLDLFGNYFINLAVTSGTETMGSQVTGFAFTHAEPFRNRTNAQSSLVGELQFQGQPVSGRLVVCATLGRAGTRFLQGCEPEPGGEVPPALECLRSQRQCSNRRRRNWPNPGMVIKRRATSSSRERCLTASPTTSASWR
jgi:hypothetical protein